MFTRKMDEERKILHNSEIFINLTFFINISLIPVRFGCFPHDYQNCKKSYTSHSFYNFQE